MTGEACGWCGELLDGPSWTQGTPMHRECSIRAIVGSVGHLRRRCSCYGGNESDPPGLTRREAAIAAVEEIQDTIGKPAYPGARRRSWPWPVH